MSDVAQWIAVAVIVVIAAVALVRALKKNTTDGCGDCALKEHCVKKKRKETDDETDCKR